MTLLFKFCLKMNNEIKIISQLFTVSYIRIHISCRFSCSSNNMRMVVSNLVVVIFLVFLPAVFLSQPLASTPPAVIVTPSQLPLFRVVHVAQGVGPLTVKMSTALTTALNIPAVAFLRATRFFVVANFPPSNLRNIASVITAESTANNVTSVVLSVMDIIQSTRQYTQLILGYGYGIDGPEVSNGRLFTFSMPHELQLRSLLYSERSSLPAIAGWTYIRWVHAAVGLAAPNTQKQSPLPLETTMKYVRLMTTDSASSSSDAREIGIEEAIEINDIRAAKKPGPRPDQSYTLNFEHLYPPSGTDPLFVASGLYEIKLRSQQVGSTPSPPGTFQSHFTFRPLKSYLLTILLAGNSTTIAAGKNIQVLVVDDTGGTATMTNEIA
jgi:hypothetical protein